MRYGTALALIVGMALLFGCASLLLRRRVQPDARKKFHEIGIAIFLQFGVIYAVLLAFVFNEVWTQFNDADQAVQTECADMTGIAQRAINLPDGLGRPIGEATATYLASVWNVEWPLMEMRRSNPGTGAEFALLFNTIATLPATTPLLAASRERMLALAGDAYNQREIRLFQLKSNVPPFLWVLLISSGVLLTGFIVLSGVDRRLVHASLTGIFAAFVTAILVSIHMLDYPFEGSISIDRKTVGEALVFVVNERPALEVRAALR